MERDRRGRFLVGRLLRLNCGLAAAALLVAAPVAKPAGVALRTPIAIGIVDSGIGSVDPTGHGSAVAAVLNAALGRGSWARVRSYPDLNRAGFAQPRLMAAAIRAAAAAGARLVNISQTIKGRAPRVRRAIAAAPDVLFVVAAGNEGLDLDAPGLERDPCSDPAPNLICVAATTSRGGPLARFSNRGRGSVDAAAPGAGTSFAAPRVTAGAARLLWRHPDRPVAGLRRETISRFPLPGERTR
ncbi:MAG TPA: S8 family serine peptidase [Solirubrobacterales bacterium]|nr:S8 family serine peptidase [Solirubrobacterales bacterium]